MKRIFFLIATFLFAGCTSFGDGNPYGEVLQRLCIEAVYPEGYGEFVRGGVRVTAQDVFRGDTYTGVTDDEGCAEFRIPQGVYRVSITDRADSRTVFNGVLEEVQLVEERELQMTLLYSRAGSVVFKEIYFGGCSKAPLEGTTFNDQYLILHNNDAQTQYLDGLCFGAADPMMASMTNNWVTKTPTGELIYQDFMPINECVWRFKGSGTDFPLAPGEDVVLVLKGARDFAAEFPLSVNLNKKEYFVCFSRENFPNTTQNPNPGDQIVASHILEVPKQTGEATKDKAFTLTIASPAVVIFRPGEGVDLDAYLADETQSVASAPGSSQKCIKLPWKWIIDGAEVFYGQKNTKRLTPEIDAGSVLFSVNYQGRTVYRHTNEEASAEAGYEVLLDTNNSSNDFYERTTQSLRGL